MNINIYLENTLSEELTIAAKSYGKSRNAIIREAIRDWIKQHKGEQWPDSVVNFTGIDDFPAFESLRTELKPPQEDPFA